MKITGRAMLLSLSLVLSNVSADVGDADSRGFTLLNEVSIHAARDNVWRAAMDVGQWWSSNHTISGDASRLSISPRLQGCFCETFGADAGVVHMVVTMVNPGVILRLTGGLGPLGLMGVSGNMTWEFEDAGDGTRVRFAYAVGGYRAGGLDEIADSVDFVIAEALLRLKAYVETGDPENATIE